jgi:electron-transferring-flavoprotein dehydrogenase
LAAESIFSAFDDLSTSNKMEGQRLSSYQTNMQNSWVFDELKSVRNCRPMFDYGLPIGMAYSGLSLYLLKGREPWTFHHKKADFEATEAAAEHKPIEYPKPDNMLTFDILTNLQRSGTNHDHDQPTHLKIKEEFGEIGPQLSLSEYDGPEQRFCPAKVYEYVEDSSGKKKLQINAQNCVHCKTCDIKPPHNYIKWTVPEGGGGPA